MRNDFHIVMLQVQPRIGVVAIATFVVHDYI